MKCRTVGSTLCLLAVLAFGGLVTNPSVRAQTVSSQNLVISGSIPIINSSIDLCSAILGFLGASCPISATITEIYSQPVALEVQNAPDLLQPQMLETSQLTLSPDQPVVSFDLNFSVGSHSFATSVPLPAFPVPGTFQFSVSLDSILQNLISGLGLPIPLSLLSYVADLKLNLFFSTYIQGLLTAEGFTSNIQTVIWNAPATETYDANLTELTNAAAVTLTELDSIFSFGGTLVLTVFSLPNTLYTIPNSTLTFGSTSSPTTLADWYHIQVQSQYSQPSGSGWYLSGTAAAFSIADTTVPTTGGTYQFTGWTGTGGSGYTGTQSRESLVATGPANETANWTFVQNANPASSLPAMVWAMGIVLAVALVAIIAVVTVVSLRPKRS